jgi:DNA-binding response OmpR family regulator
MADETGTKAAQGRVLVVEDDYFIANEVCDSLATMGCNVVGPFPTIAEASAAVESENLDAAVLDVNLAGDAVYPLARRLLRRRVPLLFVTGYSADLISKKFDAIPRLTKPILPGQLQTAVARLIADRQHSRTDQEPSGIDGQGPPPA